MVSDDCCAEFPGLSGGVEPNRYVSVTYQVANPMDVLSAATPSLERQNESEMIGAHARSRFKCS